MGRMEESGGEGKLYVCFCVTQIDTIFFSFGFNCMTIMLGETW